MSDLLVPSEKVGLVNSQPIQANAAPQVDATTAINAAGALRPDYTKVAANALGFVDTLMLKTDEATSWNLVNKLQRDLSVLQSDAQYKTDERLDLSKEPGGISANSAKTIYTNIQNKANELVNAYKENIAKLDPRARYDANKMAANTIRSFEVSQIEQKNHEADIALQNNLATAVTIAAEGFATSNFKPHTKAWDESIANLRAPIDRMLQAKGYDVNSIEYRQGMTAAISSSMVSRVFFDLENKRSVPSARALYRTARAEGLFTADDDLKVLTRINNIADQQRREAEARAARAEARRHRQQGIDRVNLQAQREILIRNMASYQGDKNSDEFKAMQTALDRNSAAIGATYDLGANSALVQNLKETGMSEASAYQIQLALSENKNAEASKLLEENREALDPKARVQLQDSISKLNVADAKAEAIRAGDILSQSTEAFDSTEMAVLIEQYKVVQEGALEVQGFKPDTQVSKLAVEKGLSDSLANRVKYVIEDTADPTRARAEFEYFDKKGYFTADDRKSVLSALKNLEKQTLALTQKNTKELVSGKWSEALREQKAAFYLNQVQQEDAQKEEASSKYFYKSVTEGNIVEAAKNLVSNKRSSTAQYAEAEQRAKQEELYYRSLHTQSGRDARIAMALVNEMSLDERRSCRDEYELFTKAFQKAGVTNVNTNDMVDSVKSGMGSDANFNDYKQEALTGFVVKTSNQVVMGEIEALGYEEAKELGDSADEIYANLVDKYADQVTAKDLSVLADKLAKTIGIGETKAVQRVLQASLNGKIDNVASEFQDTQDVLINVLGKESANLPGAKYDSKDEIVYRSREAITQIQRELQYRMFPNLTGLKLFNASVSDPTYRSAFDKAIQAYINLVTERAADSNYKGDIFVLNMPIGAFLDGDF